MSAHDKILHALSTPTSWGHYTPETAERLLKQLRAEDIDHVLREAAARQRAYAADHYALAEDDGPSARRKKESKLRVAEALTRLIDPAPPALIPRHVTVLPHPHAAGWLVRWRLGDESKAAFRHTQDAAAALADQLRRTATSAWKDTRPTADESTRPTGGDR